jgi:hypothetical protein
LSDPPKINAAVFNCAVSEIAHTIYLSDTTWEHILEKHGDFVTMARIAETITDPCYVGVSKKTDVTPTAIFVKTDISTSNSGTPMGVYVKHYGNGVGIITTALPTVPKKMGQRIWTKGDESGS